MEGRVQRRVWFKSSICLKSLQLGPLHSWTVDPHLKRPLYTSTRTYVSRQHASSGLERKLSYTSIPLTHPSNINHDPLVDLLPVHLEWPRAHQTLNPTTTNYTIQSTQRATSKSTLFSGLLCRRNERYTCYTKVVIPSPPSTAQGSGDFWAQPAKIRPFRTSTGFFQDLTGCKLVVINSDQLISSYFFFHKCRLLYFSL